MARLGNVIESSALTGVPLTLDDATRLSLQKQVNEGADANASMLEQLKMLTEATIASMQANQAAEPVEVTESAKATRKAPTKPVDTESVGG